MFDIGFFEVTIIFVIALLVFGPERLPELARTLGKWYANILRFIRNARQDLNKDFNMDELMQVVKEQKDEIRRLQYEINHVKQDIEQDLSKKVVEAEDFEVNNTIQSPEQEIKSDTDTQEAIPSKENNKETKV